jgi:GNAT superfamily N-acetyltransferase
LFVEPNWRRKGIATKLMNELISAMDAVKETTLQIYDKDDDDDVSASMLKTFYAKYGFVDIDADDSFGDGFMKRVTTALF